MTIIMLYSVETRNILVETEYNMMIVVSPCTISVLIIPGGDLGVKSWTWIRRAFPKSTLNADIGEQKFIPFLQVKLPFHGSYNRDTHSQSNQYWIATLSNIRNVKYKVLECLRICCKPFF